jgi:hypothetical protein
VTAEDVAQEAWIAAWRFLPGFDERAALTTWLYRLTTLLVGLAVFGRPLADGPVLVPQASRFAADAGWFWPVVEAAGVVLALLALRWPVIQLRSNRTRDIDIESERSRGCCCWSRSASMAAPVSPRSAMRSSPAPSPMPAKLSPCMSGEEAGGHQRGLGQVRWFRQDA